MAAPETARLRTMRLSWLALCVTLAGAVTLLDQLRGRIGRAAPCLIAVLLATALVVTVLYLRAKRRADAAYLDQLAERERCADFDRFSARFRSEEHTSELQSLMRISYAVFCLKKKKHHAQKFKHQHTLSYNTTHTLRDYTHTKATNNNL